VILTKDNLMKRNWVGYKKCAFCDSDESIEQLFIGCNFAKLIWWVMHFTFNIPSPMKGVSVMAGTVNVERLVVAILLGGI
jgi:hypothetical protein